MTDLLSQLDKLGAPGWFIIVASIVLIADRLGVISFIKSRYTDNQEFNQAQAEAKNAAEQSEQVALWTQMTRLQLQVLQQEEALLKYVIETSSQWHNQHSDCLNRVLEQQNEIIYKLKEIGAKFTTLVAVIERNYDRQKPATNDG